jgi:hypothetical protein
LAQFNSRKLLDEEENCNEIKFSNRHSSKYFLKMKPAANRPSEAKPFRMKNEQNIIDDLELN